MKEYIEREALIKDIENDCLEQVYYSKEDAIWCVKAAPTADVAEVIHAKWDNNGRCTNCGGHAPYYAMSVKYYESPYCFECGAKMDKETP